MFGLIQDFERIAAGLDWKIQLAAGAAGVGIGLFLWLGGLGLTTPLVILIGLVAGAVTGFLLTDRNLKLTLLSAAAAAVVAVAIEKIYSRTLGTGFFFGRLVPALFCAACGTALIFAGMVLLLLFKGAESLEYISTNEPFYDTVFAAMLAFGTVVQLILCPRMKEKFAKIRQKNKHEPEPDQRPGSWRNR